SSSPPILMATSFVSSMISGATFKRTTHRSKSAGGPGLTPQQIWVPHLRDGLIVDKVGIRAKARTVSPHSSTIPQGTPHLTHPGGCPMLNLQQKFATSRNQ